MNPIERTGRPHRGTDGLNGPIRRSNRYPGTRRRRGDSRAAVVGLQLQKTREIGPYAGDLAFAGVVVGLQFRDVFLVVGDKHSSGK